MIIVVPYQKDDVTSTTLNMGAGKAPALSITFEGGGKRNIYHLAGLCLPPSNQAYLSCHFAK